MLSPVTSEIRAGRLHGKGETKPKQIETWQATALKLDF